MRSTSTAVAFGLALLAALTPAQAWAGAAASGDSQIEVFENIQFSVLLNMDFGRIASNGNAGVVELNSGSGTRICDPGMICVGPYGLAELQLTGSDANVMVTYDPTFELSGPGQNMVAEPMFPGGSGAVIRLTGGQALVRFGGRVHVNANQAPGTYTGLFTVNLEYN